MSELFEVQDLPEQTVTEHVRKFEPKTPAAKVLMDDVQVIEKADSVPLDNPKELYDLGHEPADAMSKISGEILGQLTVEDTLNSSKTIDQLTKLTKQIDFKELKATDEPERGLQKIFKKAERALTTRVAKYQSIGNEVKKLNVDLKMQENKISKGLENMQNLAKANQQYAKVLNQYIALIYILRNKQEDTINALQERVAQGDDEAQIALPNAIQVAESLDARAYDLEQSQTMSIMTSAQLKQTSDSGYQLIRQFHSAFITTVPQLEIGLTQAVLALQQNYAQQGLNAQKAAVSELAIKNANNLNVNSRFIAESSGQPMISTDTMKQVVDALMKGADETKTIAAENAKKREQSRQEMVNIVDNFRKLTVEKKQPESEIKDV